MQTTFVVADFQSHYLFLASSKRKHGLRPYCL